MYENAGHFSHRLTPMDTDSWAAINHKTRKGFPLSAPGRGRGEVWNSKIHVAAALLRRPDICAACNEWIT
jgi:hypothetical protein